MTEFESRNTSETMLSEATLETTIAGAYQAPVP